MKSVITICFLVFAKFAFAQQVIDANKLDSWPTHGFYLVHGNPIVSVPVVQKTNGSPYFTETWMHAILVSGNNGYYELGKANLDVLHNELHFYNEKNDKLVCTLPLKEIFFTDTSTGASYHLIHSSAVPSLETAKKGWYLQLIDGEASLYWTMTKSMDDVFNPLTGAGREKLIITEAYFVLACKGTVVKIKKTTDALPALANNKEEMAAYIKKNGVPSVPGFAQWKDLIAYYNSLQ